MKRNLIKILTLTPVILILLLIGPETFGILQTTGWEYNTEPDDKMKQKDPLPKKIFKEVNKHVQGMKFISGGTFIMGNSDQSTLFNERDSTLLVNILPRRVTLSSFHICEHEVTNTEYREFVHWVRDSIARELLAGNGFEGYRNDETGELIWDKKVEWDSGDEDYTEALSPLYIPEGERFYRTKEYDNEKLSYTYMTDNSEKTTVSVYPDTLVWISGGLTYSYNEPLSKRYFWHPLYDDYPVVGISWEQAIAYCNWRTEQLKSVLSRSNNYSGMLPKFTLPTEAQWEYASLGNNDQQLDEAYRIYSHKVFPWKEKTLQDKKGNYLANFGPIIDQNGYHVKDFAERKSSTSTDSEYRHTSPIKSFPPNDFKLYETGGNVAEWTLDWARPYYSNEYQIEQNDSLKVTADDKFQTAYEKIIKQHTITSGSTPDTTNKYVVEKLVFITKFNIHDAMVTERYKNGRIVKGGSWATGPKYMQCSSREVFSQDKSSAFIGFRVAMILPEKNE